jgi:transposase
MPSYTEGFKARMIQRMAGPEGISAYALARQVGASQNSLSRWLREAPTVAFMSKKKPAKHNRPRRRTAEEKLQVVLKAASLSDEDLGTFLRSEGLHEATLEEWRTKVMEGATGALKAPHGKRSENTPEQRKIRELERDLNRKDKALAEVSALLILKKKYEAFLEGKDGDTPTRKGT